MKSSAILICIAIAVATTAGIVWRTIDYYERETIRLLTRNLDEERFRVELTRSSVSLSSFAAEWPLKAGIDRTKMSEEDMKRYAIALFVFLEGTTEPFFANEQLGMVQHVAEVEYTGDGSEKKLSKITVYGHRGRLLPHEFFFDEKTLIRVSVPFLVSL